MTPVLPPLRLVGATILRDGTLQQRSVAIADGRLTKGPLPEVNLRGYLVLPGIVDLHGDAFERHIAPHVTAPHRIETGLQAAEREAAANGVTTAWIAQDWSWDGGLRGPDFAEQVMAALEAYRRRMLIDLRLQIRCETHLIDSGPRLLAAIRRHGADYVVFSNRLAEAIEQYRTQPPEPATWPERAGRTPEAQLALLESLAARGAEVPRHLCRLAEAFDTMGVSYGSHDDRDGETRERFSMIGARIAEFPATRRAAAAARAMGDPVLMGAPDVVRGGSPSGRVAASDLIRQRLCDALVSDDHYPSLAEAAWRLVDDGLCDLPQAWAMISARPAEILRLPDRGRLDHGRRADLVVVNEETRAIEATIAGGRLAYLAGEAGRRFLTAATRVEMAAE